MTFSRIIVEVEVDNLICCSLHDVPPDFKIDTRYISVKVFTSSSIIKSM